MAPLSIPDRKPLKRPFIEANSKARPRAIVTFGRGWNALAVVRSLGRQGIEVFCGEEEGFAPCFYSKYCAGHFRYPSPSCQPAAFLDFMERKVRELAPGGDIPYVLMPVHTETYLFAEHRTRFEPHIKLPLTSIENIRQVEDKGRLSELAQRMGVRTPRNWTFHSIEELHRCVSDLPMPAFVKLREATAGIGVRRATSPEELVSAFEEFVKGYDLKPVDYPIVQGLAEGEDYCVTVLFDHGQCVASMTYHNLRTFPKQTGPGCLREAAAQPEAERVAIDLLKALGWHGIAELDFRIPRDGPPLLIEINPRFFGGLPQCLAAGVDYPHMLYQIAIGQPIGSRPSVDYSKRTETPLVAKLATLRKIIGDRTQRRQWRTMIRQHRGTIDDVICRDDPWPALGILYPIGLLLKHGRVSPALLVSERELA